MLALRRGNEAARASFYACVCVLLFVRRHSLDDRKEHRAPTVESMVQALNKRKNREDRDPTAVANGTSDPWKAREDDLLRTFVRMYGRRWTLVGAAMVANDCMRNSAKCRNRWMRLQQRDPTIHAVMTRNAPYKRCTICNEIKRGHTCRGPVGPRLSESTVVVTTGSADNMHT